MKKVIKKFTVIFLSVVAAVCGCAAFSACFKGGDDNGGNSNNESVGSLYGNWDEYDGVKVAFADEVTYNDGEIKVNSVLPELNCKLGEKQYMIIDFNIQAPYDNDGRETVTADLKIQPATAVRATIQDTNTADTSNETKDDITEIKATYKIPEKAETVRNMRLVIQVEAKDRGLTDIDLTFENSGEIQGVKTEKIEKSAVMGYTEELEYDYSVVVGVSNKSVKDIIIPSINTSSYYRTYVEIIREEAFADMQAVERIIIPHSLLNVGKKTISDCKGLESITVDSENPNYKSEKNCLLSKDGKTLIAGCKKSEIPNSVTNIGTNAFCCCSELVSLTIPNSVTNIDISAFKGCLIEKVTLPLSALYFIEKNNLKTVIITNGNSIDQTVFKECSELLSITLPNSITDIRNYAFSKCSKLEYIEVDLENPKYGSKGNCLLSKDGKTLIAGCKNSTIPSSVTKISGCAFYNCIGLTNLIIPSSVTSIDEGAFNCCIGLTNIVVESGNPKYKSVGNCLLSNYGTILVLGCKNSVIPDSVMSIGNVAFCGNISLRFITLPNSVTSIGAGAFNGCTGLTGIIMSNSVTSIGSCAFTFCEGIKSITIPKSVTSIGDGAFEGCSGLTNLTYKGTKAQWKVIKKGSSWNNKSGNYTVHCTDGDLTKAEAG